MSPEITNVAGEPITGGSGVSTTELGLNSVSPASQGVHDILSAHVRLTAISRIAESAKRCRILYQNGNVAMIRWVSTKDSYSKKSRRFACG